MSPDNFFDASDKPLEIKKNYGPNEPTLPAANTFTAIRSDNEWLKKYLPDGHHSQTGKFKFKFIKFLCSVAAIEQFSTMLNNK